MPGRAALQVPSASLRAGLFDCGSQKARTYAQDDKFWGGLGGKDERVRRRVFDEDAAVHDDVDVVLFGFLGGREVDDAELGPEVGELEGDHLVDDVGDEVGEAEDVDDVGALGEVGEGGVGFFAEDGIDGGIDGENAVAVLLHVGGDGVAGLDGVVGEADDGEGAGNVREEIGCGGDAEHVEDMGRIVHGGWTLLEGRKLPTGRCMVWLAWKSTQSDAQGGEKGSCVRLQSEVVGAE